MTAMRIIVQKPRMNTHERRNDRCADLSHLAMHNDFWLFTVSFITSFVWVDTTWSSKLSAAEKSII